MNSAVYIGAGLDIVPIIVLSEIKKFIYIDSLPQSEYGLYGFGNKTFKDKRFIDRLNLIMYNNNFKRIKQNGNLYEFQNGDRILKYYISTPFPENVTSETIEEINQCNTLILSGFCPHKIIIELMPKLNYIIGNKHTVYTHDEYEDEEQKNNSVFQYLINNEGICKNYYLVKEKNFDNFQYWDYKNISPSIKENIEIIKVSNIKQFEKLK